MRYGYTLYEISKTTDGHTTYSTVEQTLVDPTQRDIIDLIRGLRPWATERLAGERRDLSLYQAIFSRLDEDGEAYLPIEHCYLVWDGHSEIGVCRDRELAAAVGRTR
ncbi:MAG: hypothetical protein ACRDJE_14205 [Dehalococcoidia bacterium]